MPRFARTDSSRADPSLPLSLNARILEQPVAGVSTAKTDAGLDFEVRIHLPFRVVCRGSLDGLKGSRRVGAQSSVARNGTDVR